MSKMLVNIRRVVDAVSSRTTQQDVLFEAILNSIHANASRITCRLTGTQDVLTGDNDNQVVPRKIDRIEVEDNGDGFDEGNYQSFGKYGTDYKIELGCKGIGRFVFLKVFDTVRYTSLLVCSQNKREFEFHIDFESDDIREEPIAVSENKTILSLSGVTERYYSKDKEIDRRLDLDLNEISQNVLRHLVPTLFFRKREGHSIQIIFADTSSEDSVEISEADIPNFSTRKFSVTDADHKDIGFALHHFISKETGRLDSFHCGNGRTVCQFSDHDFRPQGFSGWLLLESDYLDARVNNDRNDFDYIHPKIADLFSSLSWEMINRSLKAAVSELVRQKIPEVEETNKKQLLEIQEERPYLTQYIDEDDLEIAGFISKKQIIDKAKKRFDDAKDHLLAHAGKEEYSDKDLDEAMQVAQDELIAYIQDRVVIIRRLKGMLANKEQSEKVIHNLFMERNTEDHEYDYCSTKRNNLWVLDDRFTSYSYAASEKTIRRILAQAGTENDRDRPDLALFFSQNPDDRRAGLKAVVVELKSFNDQGKSDREKFEGIQQLIDDIVAFQKKEEIEEIWAFLVTDVDEKMANRLVMNKYTRLFSIKTPIYHQYYEQMKTSIYVVGAQSLILDAEARNKVFIDIINKQSRLSKWLADPQQSDAKDEV
jgi:hypothetical protein